MLRRTESVEGELYGPVNVAGGAEPRTWLPATRMAEAIAAAREAAERLTAGDPTGDVAVGPEFPPLGSTRSRR